jgi:hypothetical protein
MHTKGMSRRDVVALLAALGTAACGNDRAAPSAGAPRSPAGSGTSLVFENDKVRVTEHVGRSRLSVCGTGLHSHPPHLTITLTDVKARVTIPGREPFIAENKAGDVFWDPGGPHTVENLGDGEPRAYRVELKTG